MSVLELLNYFQFNLADVVIDVDFKKSKFMYVDLLEILWSIIP